MEHITVLKAEAVEALALKSSSVVVDATYGGGGHARAICEKLGETGAFIGLDVDETAFTKNPLGKVKPRNHLICSNFSNINTVLSSLHITQVDAILADLGWRSEQFSEGGKGFSFAVDEPLLMTFGNPGDYLFTADDLVNEWAEEDIANVIFGYGEERFARRIAKAIVLERQKTPIKTSLQLAEIVKKAIPRHRSFGINPATKTFQAIRIAVNDELRQLETFISESAKVLRANGRLAIITFHSLEDRIVKLAFRELASTTDFSVLTKKPIIPSAEEIISNPRARSAKLRILTKNYPTYEQNFTNQFIP